MKVVLLKDVKGVGHKFDEKEVADGYATNALIPRGLALPASSAAQVNAIKEKLEKEKSDKGKSEAENISKLSGISLTVKVKTNEKGHLFEKLTARKVAELLRKDKRIEVDFAYLNLFEGIRDVGTYEIPVKVGEKLSHFTLVVEPQ